MSAKTLGPGIASILIACVLASCGGGGSSAIAVAPQQPPTPQPSPTVQPSPSPAPSTVVTAIGAINGTDDAFTPPDGDTGAGGNGNPVDGITCDATMSNKYHVHAFFGFFVNGAYYGVPDTIGMVNPGPEPQNHFTNTATCFYHIHAHDASGIFHLEDPDPNGVPRTGSLFTSKNVFDVWGITVNASQLGQFMGPVRVFTSGQVYRGGQQIISRTTYAQWNGDPNQIPLYSHEVIWIEVGPTYPAELPSVTFYTNY